MNITVIGVGYVGLSTGLLCAKAGHQVHFCDSNEERIRLLVDEKKTDLPVFQEALEAYYDRLSFDVEHDSSFNPDIVFCCVGTPEGEDFSLDMSYFDLAVRACPKDTVFVQRSTCMPGTADKYAGLFEDYVVMPEFLREKTAWEDSLNPSRIVFGIIGETSARYEFLIKLHSIFNPNKADTYILNFVQSELVKLVSNSFLATKISFATSIADLCETLKVNAKEVLRAVGADPRIGQDMFRLDGGFGGACLPKDTQALASLTDDVLLDEVLHVNRRAQRKNKNG